METLKTYYVGTHRYSWKAGEPLEIIGVAMVAPEEGADLRPCFQVCAKSGEEDFQPICDHVHYELISENDVRSGQIPEAIH